MYRFTLLAIVIFLAITPKVGKSQSSIMQSDTLREIGPTSPLQITFDVYNPSPKINNGRAVAYVTGGTSPYSYKWSKQNVALSSSEATKLTEGEEYTLWVTDAIGLKDSAVVAVPAESVSENINSTFVPIVDFMSTVVMFDVFAYFGIYDPVIHDEEGAIMYHPNGDPRTTNIPFVVIWLILGATFFTLFMRFVNISGFKHAIQLISGKYDNPAHSGEVSHFQALATALSATVGLGNIAGVAVAISIGGPGATFWMILAGLLGMSSKFVECTLGVKYRKVEKDGSISGGPMFYLSEALKKKNLGGLGKVLAVLFAILVIGGSFGGGNMFQANQAFSQLVVIYPALDGHGWMFGVILAILVGAVIIGGIKSIAKVTEKIVPFMAIMYVTVALIIILINISHTGEAFSLIFFGAFAPSAIKGGIIGVLIVGFQRAAFSNEAGVGSASIAHSAVKTDEPITEGIVALLEPFIDTVVICTMTALVLIFTGFHENPTGLEGAQLTSAAFKSVFSWFPYLLVIAILLFAFSTMISWSYYGQKGFNYLFGSFFERKFGTKKHMRLTYQIIFLGFIIVGASSELGAVIDFSDMMILSMAFPNILGLIILAPEVKRDLISYLKRVKSGEIKKYK
ncbi:MAG: alanine:cation symporter family protein [Bacteroidales bacterium]|nr:alanine:cation symporter family protein [Bacteroidales bacterium]MCF8456349.1 alanine:cation symporter family protein [Bacteroidales bacterium]